MSAKKKQAVARIKLLAWLQNLKSQKEDPLSIELTLARRQRDEANDRLQFEVQKAKDLQQLLDVAGGARIADLSKDAHWKLLFDYDYFWRVAEALAGYFDNPAQWFIHLQGSGLDAIANQIHQEHMKSGNRTGFYIRKTLRVFRRFHGSDEYTQFVKSLPEPTLKNLEKIARERVAASEEDQG
jgi:hypothetical protein